MDGCVRIIIPFPNPSLPTQYRDGDGRVSLDLSEKAALRISKSLDELSDVAKIKLDEVLGFDIPTTPKNRHLLHEQIGVARYNNPFSGINVLVEVGSTFLNHSRLYVQSYVEGNYDVELTVGTDHWITGASDLLLKDIPFEDIAINYDQATIEAYQAVTAYADGNIG